MTTNTPKKRLPKRTDGYDSFMMLYSLSDEEAARRIMAMSEDEYRAFSEWHDARIRKTLMDIRRKLPVGKQVDLYRSDVRRSESRISRVEGIRTNRGMLEVLDDLTGTHPLICRSPEDRTDLAVTREAADTLLGLMADIGVKDRQEAALILESLLAQQARRLVSARQPSKPYASRGKT